MQISAKAKTVLFISAFLFLTAGALKAGNNLSVPKLHTNELSQPDTLDLCSANDFAVLPAQIANQDNGIGGQLQNPSVQSISKFIWFLFPFHITLRCIKWVLPVKSHRTRHNSKYINAIIELQTVK